MKALDRISRARAGLIMTAPFFATIALDMGATEKPDIETMATDGKSLFFNAEFVAECSDPELRGVIAHEAMHVAMLHHVRREGRDPKMWNVATDYAINAALIKEGFTLPAGILHDLRFADMSVEAIYAALARNGDKPEDHKGQIGDVLDAAPDGDPAAQKAAELSAKALVMNAAQVAARSDLPSEAGARLAGDYRRPVIDWRSVLRRFVDESGRKDFSWSRPNRRFVGQGLYLPGTIPDGMARLAIVIDTSGSIDAAAFAAFLSEVNAAVADAGPDLVDVIQCDTKIRARQAFQAGEDIAVTLTGGGGTNLAPALAECGDASAVLVFTDCEFPRPLDPIAPPVLWAAWGNAPAPAWGECIRVS